MSGTRELLKLADFWCVYVLLLNVLAFLIKGRKQSDEEIGNLR